MAFRSFSSATLKGKTAERKARRDAAKRRRDDNKRADMEAKAAMDRRAAAAVELRKNMEKRKEPPAKRTRTDPDPCPVSSSSKSSPPTSSSTGTVLDLATPLKLEKGCRLEVLWTVEESDEVVTGKTETDKHIWWGCSYIGPRPGVHQVLDEDENDTEKVLVQVCDLLYDAKPPHFPECAVNASAFLSEHQLYDVDFKGCLAWRHEGSSWEPKDEPPSPSPSSVTNDSDVSISLGTTPDQVRLRITNIVNGIVLNVAQRNQRLMDSASMGQQLLAGDVLSKWRSTIIEALVERATKHGTVDLKMTMETIANARQKLKHLLP